MPIEKATIAEILAPATGERQAEQEATVRASFFRTVRRAAKHIPFMEDVVASYYCALDPQTPKSSKGVLLAALAYFVVPMDIVPDFLLGLGFTDDLAVLWTAFRVVQGHIKPEHYAKARSSLGDSAPAP